MPYPQQVESALTVLAERGVPSVLYAPPLHRLAWRLGFNIPSPVAAGFVFNFAFFGIGFGIVYGLLEWFIHWSRQGIGWQQALLNTVGAGVCFGVALGLLNLHKKHQYKLPSWSELTAADREARTDK